MADELKGQNKLNKFQQYFVTTIQAMFLISPKKKNIISFTILLPTWTYIIEESREEC